MIFALRFYITILSLLCLGIIITNVFPLFPFVPTVPKGRDPNIKADTKCKSTNKDTRDEDAVALDEGVVKGVGQCHCAAARRGGKDFGFGIGFDVGITSFWDRWNKGKQWKDIRDNYAQAEE